MLVAASAVLALEGCGKSCVSVLAKAEHSLQPETLSLPTQQETTCVCLSPAGHLFAAGEACCCLLSPIRPAPSAAAMPCNLCMVCLFGVLYWPLQQLRMICTALPIDAWLY